MPNPSPMTLAHFAGKAQASEQRAALEMQLEHEALLQHNQGVRRLRSDLRDLAGRLHEASTHNPYRDAPLTVREACEMAWDFHVAMDAVCDERAAAMRAAEAGKKTVVDPFEAPKP